MVIKECGEVRKGLKLVGKTRDERADDGKGKSRELESAVLYTVFVQRDHGGRVYVPLTMIRRNAVRVATGLSLHIDRPLAQLQR